MKNKGEYENLHISLHSLDEMYTSIPGTSGRIFTQLLVFRFKNNSIKGNCTNSTNMMMSVNCVVVDVCYISINLDLHQQGRKKTFLSLIIV